MELLDLLAHGEIARILNAVAAGTSAQTSSAVDMSGAEGCLFQVAFGTITTGSVVSIKLQQSDDDGSADDYTDIAGSAVAVADTLSNKVACIFIQRPLKKYLKLVITRTTQNAVIDGVIAIKTNLKKVPATQGSTIVATSKTLVTPSEGTA